MVLNDSKVIPARLWGKRENTGGRVEVLLLEKIDKRNTFHALINPLGKLKIDERIIFTPLETRRQRRLTATSGGLSLTGFNGNKISCRLVDAKNRIVRFNGDIRKHLDKIGHIPLPPYIKRQDTPLDRNYYQTVYARNKGSVASPTAGLHFTKNLLGKIKKQGIGIAKVTLHVNYSTFKPIKETDIIKHQMYSEDYEVSAETIRAVREIKKSGGKVIAVGTTSCRVLETIAGDRNLKLLRKGLKGSTDIFIYPGYEFQLTDCLLTNFHFPKTTLFLLVCAFAGRPACLRSGRDLVTRAYQEAIDKKYRFYSYGDAMLIL